jgi:hypothetical protein
MIVLRFSHRGCFTLRKTLQLNDVCHVFNQLEAITINRESFQSHNVNDDYTMTSKAAKG